MKKVFAIILALGLVYSQVGCAKPTEIANPVHESTAEEIMETLGFTLNIPADAKNVSYSIIDMDNEYSIAQAKFTRDNQEFTYRIRSTSELEDISGANYDWTTQEEIQVSYCNGELRYNEGKEGICLWYDVVPGLMYCISVEEDASAETLLSLANEMYVPHENALAGLSMRYSSF